MCEHGPQKLVMSVSFQQVRITAPSGARAKASGRLTSLSAGTIWRVSRVAGSIS